MLMTQKINIRFLSEEYRDRDFTGKQYCMQNGIELYYHKRQHDYSSSDLRKRVSSLESKKGESSIIIPQYSPELVNKHNDGN